MEIECWRARELTESRLKRKLGMNKTLARTMVSIIRIDPIHAMLAEWPFGNIIENFEIGLELVKKSKI